MRNQDEHDDRRSDDADREPWPRGAAGRVERGPDAPNGEHGVDDDERGQDARSDREGNDLGEPAGGVEGNEADDHQRDRGEEEECRPPAPEQQVPRAGQQEIDHRGGGETAWRRPRGWGARGHCWNYASAGGGCPRYESHGPVWE